jgi:hypothetical protein
MDGHPTTRVFDQDSLQKLFPQERAGQFFEALFGDSTEGAYDIGLEFVKQTNNSLQFEFHLKQRTGQCLVCSLTAGLPTVFSRHPVINVKGLVKQIDQLLDGQTRCSDWRLGATRQVSSELHVIPLIISLEE